jgi:hypothetical protein
VPTIIALSKIEQVRQAILSEIVSGRMKAGQRLVEAKLDSPLGAFDKLRAILFCRQNKIGRVAVKKPSQVEAQRLDLLSGGRAGLSRLLANERS